MQRKTLLASACALMIAAAATPVMAQETPPAPATKAGHGHVMPGLMGGRGDAMRSDCERRCSPAKSAPQS